MAKFASLVTVSRLQNQKKEDVFWEVVCLFSKPSARLRFPGFGLLELIQIGDDSDPLFNGGGE